MISNLNPSQPQIINLALIIFGLMFVMLFVETILKWWLEPVREAEEDNEPKMLGYYYSYPEPENRVEWPNRVESLYNLKVILPEAEDFHFERNPYINTSPLDYHFEDKE